jgi:2-dehydro-3-deoxygluconokinase
MVITLGEALVAFAPTAPVTLDRAEALVPRVGGAELNFAIGVRRLGVPSAWVGRLGADPLGTLALCTLEREGVDTRWVARDRERPTGIYFREWLADGDRRPYYYRAGSAATALCADDWPAELEGVGWLHVSGITLALGEGPRALVERAVEWARERAIPISFDPNYRAALWSVDDARDPLRAVAAACDVLTTSDEEAELLFGSPDPRTCIARAHDLGIETVVVKRGADGALGSTPRELIEQPPHPAAEAVDPVGAGDGFDAALVASLLSGAPLARALELAGHVGARAVEALGEHCYPSIDALPDALRRAALPTSVAADRGGAAGRMTSGRSNDPDRSAIMR